ncbi:hypothetical protein Pelo_2112 [Pelomyxa schiedti]|nr:hypothetical protein Pelo_2112 [Pelomyxa schiedti]
MQASRPTSRVVLDSRDQFVAIAVAATTITTTTTTGGRSSCPASWLPGPLVSAEIGRRWVTCTAKMVAIHTRMPLPEKFEDIMMEPACSRDGSRARPVCFGVSFTGGVTTTLTTCDVVASSIWWRVTWVGWVDEATAVVKPWHGKPCVVDTTESCTRRRSGGEGEEAGGGGGGDRGVDRVVGEMREPEGVTGQDLVSGILPQNIIANGRWVVAFSLGNLVMWKVVVVRDEEEEGVSPGGMGEQQGGMRPKGKTRVDCTGGRAVRLRPRDGFNNVIVFQFTRCPQATGCEEGDVLSIGFHSFKLNYMQIDLKKSFETGTVQVVFAKESLECSQGMKRLVFPGNWKECIVDGRFIRDTRTVDDTHVSVLRMDTEIYPLAVLKVYDLTNRSEEAQATHTGIKYSQIESGGGLFLKCSTTTGQTAVQVVDALTGTVVFQMDSPHNRSTFALHVQDLLC